MTDTRLIPAWILRGKNRIDANILVDVRRDTINRYVGTRVEYARMRVSVGPDLTRVPS